MLPTQYREGIPRVLLEAGALGCAIVTTAMPGCTDVVRNEWNGLIVAPGDPAALATALDRLLLQDIGRRREMGRRSQTLIREVFSLDKVTEAYAASYEDVLQATA